MPYIKSTQLFVCPSDSGMNIGLIPAEPTAGQPVWKAEGTSYCLNTVVTRLGSIAAVPMPAETYLGAEIYPWHDSNGYNDWFTSSGAPARVAYFCDGHAKIASEAIIAFQCGANPHCPGINDAQGNPMVIP